jgi:hypothetical protein
MNTCLVARLRQLADEETRRGGNLYRVRALRQAALAVSGLPGPVEALGPDALAAAGIGVRLRKRIWQEFQGELC